MSDIRRQVRQVTVDAESAGRRIDNFLVSELKGVPKSRIYRMIRKGEVRVNKGRIKPTHKLSSGDVIRIPPVSMEPVRDIQANGVAWINETILYEDDWLMVVNKPSGLAVHGGSGISLGAIEMLRAARPELHYLELVHRLDRDTSGCLLLAKKRSALRKLHADFREGRVQKIYLALLTRGVRRDVVDVELPLLVEHRQNGERYVRTGPDGKVAHTRFHVIERLGEYTLCDVEIFTGRTHQIRVHAQSLGAPVAADSRYGDGAAKPTGLKRLFLHAKRLELMHPATGDAIVFDAEPEAALTGVLQVLRKGQAD